MTTPADASRRPRGRDPTALARQRDRRSSSRGRSLLGLAGVVGFLATWQLLPDVGIVDPRSCPRPPRRSRSSAQLTARPGVLAQRRAHDDRVGDRPASSRRSSATVLGTVIGMVPVPAPRDPHHGGVPATDPVGRADPARHPRSSDSRCRPRSSSSSTPASGRSSCRCSTASPTSTRSPATPRAASASTRGVALRNLVLPTALPYLMTGLRLAAAVALILAVTAEMMIGNPGLGRQLTVASANAGDIATVYAIVIVTGLLGLLINIVLPCDRAPHAVVAPVRERGGGAVTLYTSTVRTPAPKSRLWAKAGENTLYAVAPSAPAPRHLGHLADDRAGQVLPRAADDRRGVRRHLDRPRVRRRRAAEPRPAGAWRSSSPIARRRRRRHPHRAHALAARTARAAPGVLPRHPAARAHPGLRRLPRHHRRDEDHRHRRSARSGRCC